MNKSEDIGKLRDFIIDIVALSKIVRLIID